MKYFLIATLLTVPHALYSMQELPSASTVWRPRADVVKYIINTIIVPFQNKTLTHADLLRNDRGYSYTDFVMPAASLSRQCIVHPLVKTNFSSI